MAMPAYDGANGRNLRKTHYSDQNAHAHHSRKRIDGRHGGGCARQPSPGRLRKLAILQRGPVGMRGRVTATLWRAI